MIKSRFAYLAISLSLVTILVTGFALRSDEFFLIKKNFTIFSEVFQEISTRYVDDVDPEKLMRHGISSMLEKLDPYTVLFDEADTQNMEILTTGRYAGVGIEVGARSGKLVIIAPIEGYSAYRRGIRSGDIILEVDGISVQNLNVEDLQLLIRGEAGSTLKLTIERLGIDEPLTFELTRELIDVNNISYSGFLDDSKQIGFISLSRFGQNTAQELRIAIDELKKDGNLQGLVLDLRNNPGGLLDEAVRTVDLFVGPRIEVVKTQGKSIESSFSSQTESPAFYNGPLIILQNNGSASSSEIVAGALQDLDRAVVVGERSFGKGLVQIVRPLSYNVALKITTSRYYIPSGRSIQSVIYSQEDDAISQQVPDSLRNVFKTRAGRTVYDGVGIDPDVLVKRPTQSLVEVALLQHASYFFFANEYQLKNPELKSDLNGDETFALFKEFLERSEFDYTTRPQRSLAQLEDEINGSEELRLQTSRAISALKSVIEHQKAAEIQANETEIRRQLYLELISRYEGQSGRLKASLSTDPIVVKAKELVLNPSEISEMLKP
jgi:carboxyl-terminal processing protease